MAVKTSTTYICDGCEKQVAKQGELRTFTLEERRVRGEFVAKAKTDLCTTCEGKLKGAVQNLFSEAELSHLDGTVRDG